MALLQKRRRKLVERWKTIQSWCETKARFWREQPRFCIRAYQIGSEFPKALSLKFCLLLISSFISDASLVGFSLRRGTTLNLVTTEALLNF